MNRIERELLEATRENNLAEVRRLLSVGADVNAKGHDDWTSLQWACYRGHLAVVIELLEHGADIEVKDNDGWTALHFALYHLPVLKALLSGGADMLVANNDGISPIQLAVGRGNSAVSKCLLQHFYVTIIRRLPLHELLKDLTWIGDPNSSDAPPLRSALHRNVLGTEDVVEIVEYLVERNHELISSRDQDGSLPLHVACRRCASFAIVQSLVDHYPASVKRETPEGDLPLFLACETPKSSLDTIFLLLKLYPDLVYHRRPDVVYHRSLENRCGSCCCCS
jgi:ankyrin repeat protein